MKWKIPLYKVHVDDEDVQAVSKVIKRGMDWAIGPEIEQFEKLLANYVGSDYCLTFNSGTSAGHAALLALNIKTNDEIIIPSFTFIATANWTLMVNAKPKFVDIEEDTLGLDPQKVKSSITNKTRVIIPVHYAGMPCHIDELTKIARKQKITVIEDAAESLGATIGKQKVGTFGDLSIFSFAGNKIMTTGEGGAITTNSKTLYEKLKLLRSHGRLINNNYFSSNEIPKYVTLGYNWRMSSMTAALGISQLNKFEKLVNLRRKNAKYLSSKLSKYKYIDVPKEPNGYRHVYQLYTIQLENSKIRNNLSKFLTKKGIMTKIFFQPTHMTDFYKKQIYGKSAKLPITEKIYEKILTLPMYPGLKKEELDYICNSVGEFMDRNSN
jgi:perosamine synthetase